MSKRKLHLTFSLIAFVALSAAPHVAQAQSTCAPEQRKQFALTALDKDNNVIDNLRAEHLSLKVGGAPATVSDLAFQTKFPLDIAIVIDASVSQEKSLPAEKLAAQTVITSAALTGRDRVAVVSFSDKPKYIQTLTSDLSGLATAIDRIQVEIPPGYIGGGVVVSRNGPPPSGPLRGSTSLWDSVRIVTTELFATKTDRRRVLLLLSDGIDTSSSEKLKVAIEEALTHDVTVFAIGFADALNRTVDQDALKKLSEQTGGVAEVPGAKKEKLDAAATEIARRLRDHYVVGYCGGAAKDRAKLQLEVVDPEMRKAKPVLAYKRY